MGDATVNSAEKSAGKSKEPKTPKKSWFKGLKSEFSKIIWPDRETLFKESVTVVVISIALGVLIALVDMVIKAGINVII
ncbi:MAG: preprotein translocase subunit SecE [Lachnospiraceae bacterium]|nr:preprotein translocase subunit SecE [Lachnospiraceae bacterium]